MAKKQRSHPLSISPSGRGRKTIPKYLFDKDEWMLGEKIPDSDIFFFQIPFSAFASDTSFPFIKNYKKVLAVFKRFEMHFYFGRKDSFEVGESILNALIDRPNFGRDLNANIVTWSRKLIESAEQISKRPLKEYTNRKLWELYKKHDEVHTKLYTYGWLPVAVDMFHNNMTDKLKQYLYSVCDSKIQAEEAFVTLATPSKKTILADEREDFLKIYERFKRLPREYAHSASSSWPRGRNDKFQTQLQKHAEKWGHLGYIYAGNVKPFGAGHYLAEMRDLLATKISGSTLLRKEAAQLATAKQKQAELYKQLKINPLYRRLFTVAQDFALTKLIRRHAQLRDLFLLHNTLLKGIAKRLDMTRFQVQFMLQHEVKDALLHGQVDKRILAQRLQHCVLYTEKNFEKVYAGSLEKKLIKTIKTEIDKNQKEFVGQTAQAGFARGIVKRIFRAKDMGKMNKGDILVSIATDPDIVPAMKKAGAIVTDQGGITSHAAIVSRELGVPCIIGTKIASQILKDGDTVEVDATRGIVRKLK